MSEERVDLAVVGAGAAGLFAAIWASRHARPLLAAGAPPLRIVALDGARKLGAKILVAGGGRCNVTHWRVDERDYAGSTAPAIRKVLRRFDVEATRAFFLEHGVELKQEETGKLFPTTDDAHTVLNALLHAVADAGVELRHPCAVRSVARAAEGFLLQTDGGALTARRVILCTGGKALPKSGSAGDGYPMATALGHTLTPEIVPALAPLRLAADHWVTRLSGLTVRAELSLHAGSGRRLIAFADSTLCTHFGLSGPSALNISRYWSVGRVADPQVQMLMNWVPGMDAQACDRALLEGKGRSTLSALRELRDAPLPERLARALCEAAGIDPAATPQQLPRERRRELVALLTATPLPIEGDRGFTFAEATAGGVPLAQLRLETMESRLCPGLFIAGELCDVDGRIGGFNFQWAWASGFIAGKSAAEALLRAPMEGDAPQAHPAAPAPSPTPRSEE